MSSQNPNSDDQQAILQVERETMAAIQHRNVDALSRLLADEFIYRTPGSEDAGKAEFLNNIASIPVEILAVWGDELRVYICGEMAVLTGVQRAKYRAGDGAEGVSSVAFTDVLRKREGRWLMVLAYGVELPPSG